MAEFVGRLNGSSESTSRRTRDMLLSAMERVERHGRETKDKISLEIRSAMEGVERKRLQTKTILTKAKSELLTAMEEKEQSRLKNMDLKGGRIITPEAVHRYREPYTYNASCGSVLELLFFQRFWMNVSNHIPNWIMPCSLTMLGLVINLACCTLLIVHSPDATAEVPSWAIVLCAFGIFAYQTLDALDGKQAAKLQNTYLEEVADHGSDSLSSTFVTLALGVTLQLGSAPGWLFLLTVTTLVAFYTTHWQTHVTDVVVFGKVDVTEAQCGMMLAHLATAVFGQEIWKVQFDWLGLELRQIAVLCVVLFLCGTMVGNMRIVAGAPTPLDSFASIPRKSGIVTIYPAVPLAIWLAAAVYTSSALLNEAPCLLCLFYGVIFSKLLLHLQVTTLGGTQCELWDSSLSAPLLLGLNQHLGLVPLYTALLGGMVFVTMDLLRFATYLSWDICDFQDIYIFSLKYPLGHPRNRAGTLGIYVNGLNNQQVVERLRALSIGSISDVDDPIVNSPEPSH